MEVDLKKYIKGNTENVGKCTKIILNLVKIVHYFGKVCYNSKHINSYTNLCIEG